jgi:bacteriorhodopsin
VVRLAFAATGRDSATASADTHVERALSEMGSRHSMSSRVPWTWTVLCAAVVAAVVVVTSLSGPAWDTERDGYEFFTGFEVFALVSFTAFVAWLVGLGVILLLDAVVGRRARGGEARRADGILRSPTN